MDIDMEDDPVVQEIPVFLSKTLAENLYVFQYPLRSVSVETEPPNVIAARIKPKVQEVELEVEIPTRTKNYDKSKGEQISINADGANKHSNPDDQNFFKSSVMDKIIYTSTRAHLEPGRYAVGIISNNELHLNPLHGILHVKPAFQYLDKADSKTKSETAKEPGAEPGSDEDDDELLDINVKFAKNESERTKAAREKSYLHHQKKNAEEVWIDTPLYQYKTEESLLGRNHLICSNPENVVSNLTLPKDKFLSALIGPCPESEDLKNKMSHGNVSMFQIQNLTLSEQVKYFMINVKVISFSRLCSVLQVTGEAQQQQLLRVLQQVALLVQGNWVVKSEVLYPYSDKEKPKLCGVNGIHPEILAKARDHVVYQFTLSRFVDRKAATIATKIPTEDMKVILQQMATYIPEKGWEFMLPFDQAFINKYPDVVQRQEMLYKAKQQQLQQQLNTGDFKTPKTEQGDSPGKGRKARRRSRKDSCSSDSGSESKK